MNLSMQIGRGVAALALCAAVSAYAITHPVAANAATPGKAVATLAVVSVTAQHTVVVKSRMERKRSEARVAACATTVEVGAPIALGANNAAKAPR